MNSASAGIPPIPLPVIVLAAGRGRRLGLPKLLAAYAGRTFLERILIRCAHSGSPVTLTVSPDLRARAEAALQDLQTRLGLPRPKVVEADPDGDMLDSLKTALRAEARAPGVWVWPVDAPFISAPGWTSAVAAVRTDPARVLQLRCGGRGGHPLWLPDSLRPALLTGHWENGLAGFLAGLERPRLHCLELAGEHLRDVNTPEDLHALTLAE
ncbi:MAG: nucleotidyltransferase family protein [Deltaproteobacteria bacterium]|nr:nucleotidyltransferase family protein [Deltaproteobacteria bacterium]